MAAAVQQFDRSVFLSEFTALCDSLSASYSRQTIEQILTAFEEHLENSVVWMRCTSKPADVLNFRIAFQCRLIDTTAIAAHAGWVEIDHPLAHLVRSWSSQRNAEQWCDFDPSRGTAKTWVYFRQMQSIENILSTPGLPALVTARIPDLQALGLDRVTFTAVDYYSRTMNLYFLVPGPLTIERATGYTSLARSTPPSEAEFEILKNYMVPMFTFAVTIAHETGHIHRVAFYAAVKNAESFSPLNERLRKFFKEAPSHDPQKLMIVSWSYGAGDSKYMKGESSYAGDLDLLSRNMFASWTETPA